jgi:hypothetical protein
MSQEGMSRPTSVQTWVCCGTRHRLNLGAKRCGEQMRLFKCQLPNLGLYWHVSYLAGIEGTV